MTIFMDTGGGDIYGGPTKEDVIAVMQKDCGDMFDAKAIFEVPSTTPMWVEADNADGRRKSTIGEEYDAALGTYCVASENC